jgi:hypothetical protein
MQTKTVIQFSTVPSFRRRLRRVLGVLRRLYGRGRGSISPMTCARISACPMAGVARGPMRPPGATPTGASEHRASRKGGAPRFSLQFRVRSCYASAGATTGRAQACSEATGQGRCRNDRGAFRRVIRPAACGTCPCQPRGAETPRPRSRLVAGQSRQPAEGSRARPAGRRMAAARNAVTHPRVVVTDIEARLGTRYTGETIEALIHRYPGVGSSG